MTPKKRVPVVKKVPAKPVPAVVEEPTTPTVMLWVLKDVALAQLVARLHTAPGGRLEVRGTADGKLAFRILPIGIEVTTEGDIVVEPTF